MRFVSAITAALLLAGCEAPPPKEAKGAAVQPPAANYDYRYAFRVPGERIAALQESHARGCEQLGPARCRITALKYGVDDRNQASAVLALTLDPAIARAFGKAATDTALKAKGALVSAEVLDDPAAGSVPARLKRAAEDAEAKLKDVTDPDERTALAADAARARAAIATISELDRANGPMLATAPVLINYTAGSGSGVGGASFEGAGDALDGVARWPRDHPGRDRPLAHPPDRRRAPACASSSPTRSPHRPAPRKPRNPASSSACSTATSPRPKSPSARKSDRLIAAPPLLR